MACVWIGKQRWYRRLIPSRTGKARALEEDFSLEDLIGKLVVSWMIVSPEEDMFSRLFTVFPSYVDFFEYQNYVAPSRRAFFEIILGDFPQKPHFDIDISDSTFSESDLDLEAENVLNELWEALQGVGKEHDLEWIPEQNFLLYTSHGPSKRSFHIVILHYCHSNAKNAKKFYALVTDRLSPRARRWVDPMVYSSKQAFRIVGSQKLGSGRPKQFQETWSWKGREITHVYSEPILSETHRQMTILHESLVSWVVGSVYLPDFEDPPVSEVQIPPGYPPSFSSFLWDGKTLTEAVQKLVQAEKEASGSTEGIPYEISDTWQGNFLSLRRILPSYCLLCQRVHEHQNPYLFRWENTLYFHCRRAPKENRLAIAVANFFPEEGEKPSEQQPKEETIPPEGPVLCLGTWYETLLPSLGWSGPSESLVGEKFSSLQNMYLREIREERETEEREREKRTDEHPEWLEAFYNG